MGYVWMPWLKLPRLDEDNNRELVDNIVANQTHQHKQDTQKIIEEAEKIASEIEEMINDLKKTLTT